MYLNYIIHLYIHIYTILRSKIYISYIYTNIYVYNYTYIIFDTIIYISFTFSYFADAFIQSDLQLGNT